jgi:hypothetical protein
MAIPSEDAALALKGITEQPAQLDLTAEAAMPVIPESGTDLPGVDILAPPPPAAGEQPFQVAGRMDTIRKIIGERTLQAEKNVLPKIKDDPVQMIGDTILMRPLEQPEIDRLANAIGGEYTKGINIPKIAEDMNLPSLADYVAKLKDANQGLFEEARRGTLNFEAILQKANAKDIDDVIYDWMKRAPGAGANAEDTLAGLLAAVTLTRETQGAWLKAFSTTDPVAREAAKTRAAQMMAMEFELYANVSGAGSEAGRLLYMLSNTQKLAGINLSDRADQLVKLLAGGAADLEYIGQQYLTMPSPTARAAMVKQSFLAKSMDVMAEVWVNSLLSAPVTHVVNVMGNTVFGFMKVLETGMAGGIGAARSAITGNADRVYFGEALAQIRGIKEGWKDAMLVSGKTLYLEEAQDITSKLDLRNRRAIGTSGDPAVMVEELRNGNYAAGAVNLLGISARMPGRFLLAEDQFFKGVGYRMFLHSEAERSALRLYDQAIAAGRSVDDAKAMAATERTRIMTDPPQNVIKTIQDAAQEMTFQKGFEPGGVLAGMQQVVAHPLMKLFVPFFKTPTNIAAALIERSPIALATPAFWSAIKAGGRDADIAMAKLTTGSLIMGGFAAYASGTEDDGSVIISGAGPSEPQARQAFERKGFLPYSIAVRQDDGSYRSITYNRFDPISGLLGMAADFAYYANHEGDDKILDDLAIAASMSIVNYMGDQPMVSGLKDLFSAFSMPNPRERADKLLQLMGEKAAGGALAFVPGHSAFWSTMSRISDPVKKNTGAPAEGLFGEDVTELPAAFKGFYTALQKAQAQNPYFNKKLPPALNEWAEPMTAGNGAGWEWFSPIRIKNSNFADVDDEIIKIGGGVSPTPKKIQGVDLNAEQHNRWKEIANELGLLPALQSLIYSEGYQSLFHNEDKQGEIARITSMYRKAARETLLLEDSALADKVAMQK